MNQPEPIHVTPLNDLREHGTNAGTVCWCSPRVEAQDGGQVVIHNSADGREMLEEMDGLLSDRPIGLFLAQVIRSWALPSLPGEFADDQAHKLAWNWLCRRYMFYRYRNETSSFNIQEWGDRAAADFLELFLPRPEVGNEG